MSPLPNWREGTPRGVTDPRAPNGDPIETPTDHRWLWHIETESAVTAPMGSSLARLRDRLRAYLNETCQHHWVHYDGDNQSEDGISEHDQCLWCCSVEWAADRAEPEASDTTEGAR